MPRYMSFQHTTDQIRNGTKTVTRRNGWWNLKPGTVINACVKSQGLRKGEKVQVIRQIEIVSTQEIRLGNITQADVAAEGFPFWTPETFVNFFIAKHKHVDEDSILNRIEFKYI